MALRGVGRKAQILSRQAIEHSTLLFSPLVELELQYLYEIRRLTVPPDTLITVLAEEIGLGRTEVPLHPMIAIAKTLTLTRDVFDRLIVATTIATQEARLITRDTHIRQHSTIAF